MKRLKSGIISWILVIAFCTSSVLPMLTGCTPSERNASKVVLNEVMTKNDSVFPDENNEYHDWVELYNDGDKDADISGYGLSDNLLDGVKFVFPKGSVIKAKGFMIVFCSGDSTMGKMYAPFKLSTSDDLIFYDNTGKELASLDLGSIVVEATQSLSRVVGSDKWEAMSPTPGFENSQSGIEAFAAQKNQINENTEHTLVINEFMASNKTTICDTNGEYSDWIELYNNTDEAINLSGYGVSDNSDELNRLVIPDGVTIEPHAYLLIFCSGNSGLVNGELHAPFKLKAYAEEVIISTPDGMVVDRTSYEKQQADFSMARVPDGTGAFESTDKPTPGYPNTEEGYEQFAARYSIPTSDLYISEIIGLSDTNYDGCNDWIELHNATSADINLTGYGLTDNPENPAKWLFPDCVIKSGGYLVITAGGEKADKQLHVDFGISGDGDAVYFFDPQGKLLDKLKVDKFIYNHSVGRAADKSIRYYYTPTPNAQNSGDTYIGITSMPTFTVTPGIYDEAVSVGFKCGANEKVYYTTDCTKPTANSTAYSGEPITVSKNTVIRAVTVRDGYYNGISEKVGTYLFTTDGASHNLPVMSLVSSPDNLWDRNTGIYCYGNKWSPNNGDTWPYWQTPANFWSREDVPAAFEVFGDDGKSVFSQNVDMKITGAFGRGREQKGIAITARDKYGSDRMRYKFFDNLDYTEYKSLVLRCGAQDQANGKIRDELSVAVLRDSGIRCLYQEYEPYILYLNGNYWGVYFMREKRNRFFVAQHENMDNATDLDLIKSETRYNYGSVEEWKAVQNYVRTHDLTDDAAYNYVAERVDLDSFMDYMIAEIYVANTDTWNMQMYKVDGGKWRFIYYDFCWGWGSPEHKTLAKRRLPSEPGSDMFNALLRRSDWRDAFIRRFAELMKTAYNPERVLAAIDELYNQVEPEIRRERSLFNSSDSPYRQLWGWVDPSNYASYDGFNSHINRIKAFAEKRPEQMKQQLKAEFNLSDEYMAEVFG